jgi:beta-lactamase regulating signal transducer with metallopeptidase domain
MNQTINTALLAILNSLWMVAAVAAVAALAMKAVPRVNAATRYAVWWSVLGVVLMLPLAMVMRGQPSEPAGKAADSLTASAITAASSVTPPVTVEAVSAEPAPLHQDAVHSPLLPFQLRAGAWPVWIFAVWLAIFLFHAARIVWSYRYLRGVKHRAHAPDRARRRDFEEWAMACHVHRPVQLLLSNEVGSPMAVGFRNPAVILPEALVSQLTPEDLDHVLLHELAHIARYDDWTKLAAHLASATLFLHPVAAWILGRIEREREIACDDWVVAETGTVQPYAASLARLLELCVVRRRDLLAAGLAGRCSQLRERVERLVERAIRNANGIVQNETPQASPGRVALCVAALMVVVAAGAYSPSWIAFAQQEPAPVASATPAAASAAAPAATPAAAPEAPAPSADPAPAPAPHANVVPAPEAQAPDAAKSSENKSGESLLTALAAAGYTNLSVDEIIALKDIGVNGDFINRINRAGLGKLTIKQIGDLRMQGATPEYVQAVRDAGLRDLTFDEILKMRMHGVKPEFLKEIRTLGFGPYTAKQVTDFAMYGARIEFFRALKQEGFAQADAADIVQAAMYGLRAEGIREAKKYGPSMSLKQMIRLKQAGVI